MADLSEPQKKMLVASEPDDVTGMEGAGVELRTGADYKVANALKSKGLGYVQGPGGALPGMYWSNADGLQARRDILGLPDPVDDEEDDD